MDTQTGNRQERRKQRTREAIQDAALALLAERGYRATTMGAIAEAADVAPRTVTFHFPTKADLLFDADPFTLESLEVRLDNRADGESTLTALRDWMTGTMLELSSGASDTQQRVWRRRALRAQVIGSDDELRARARAGYFPYEQLIAAHIAADLGVPPDSLVPRLAAATSVTGLRELYQSYEARSSGVTESTNALIALVDSVLAFTEAGIEATR
jgi:AcrR family transcriptional regulator